MKTIKDKAFKKIEKQFEDFSNLILEQLDNIKSIYTNDLNILYNDVNAKILNNEEKINSFENKIKENIVKTMALHKPVAGDIRELFSIYDMTTNLERVGDYVVKISKLSSGHNKQKLKKSSKMILSMLEITTKMVNSALISFFNSNIDEAKWTIKKDKTVDVMYNKILSGFLEDNKLNKDLKLNLSIWLDIGYILASTERIGDQATNIAESSLYSIKGKNIKHKN